DRMPFRQAHFSERPVKVMSLSRTMTPHSRKGPSGSALRHPSLYKFSMVFWETKRSSRGEGSFSNRSLKKNRSVSSIERKPETGISRLPQLTQVRSISRFGLSVLTVVFEDGVDIYFARQLVFERLQNARGSLPPGIPEPEMGPITTAMGEIYQYYLESDSLNM